MSTFFFSSLPLHDDDGDDGGGDGDGGDGGGGDGVGGDCGGGYLFLMIIVMIVPIVLLP